MFDKTSRVSLHPNVASFVGYTGEITENELDDGPWWTKSEEK